MRLSLGAWQWTVALFVGHWRLALLLVPIAMLAMAIAGYAWWWRVLADRVHDTVVGIQDAQKQLGRNIEWNSLEIKGFPYLVDATLTKARLLAPDIGAVWDGERILVRLKPFALNKIAVSLEGEQHIFYVADGRWIEADARADKALFRAASRDTAQSVSADIERLTGKGRIDASDFHFILERAVLGVSLIAPSEVNPLPRADIVAQVSNLGLQGNLDLPLGPSIELIDFDVGINLPEKLPVATVQAVISAWRETDTPLQVRKFVFDWGGVSVAAVGEIKLDERDLPEGNLRLTLGNHSRILQLLESGGWITKETHAAAKPVLDVLSFVSGDPKRRISVPLRFEKGDVYLGPARVMKMQPAAPPPPIPDFVP